MRITRERSANSVVYTETSDDDGVTWTVVDATRFEDRPPLYVRVSITPAELILVLQQVIEKWPEAKLHKNDVTCNLTVEADGIYGIGMVDLLDAHLDDFTDQYSEAFTLGTNDEDEN